MNQLQHIASHINALQHDIRAEVIINHLIDSEDLKPDEYIVHKEGQFSRAYRFDVLDTKVLIGANENKPTLSFNLSRDSIYDALPEGISHSPTNDIPGKDVDTMIREHNAQKKQQKAARKFFQPFENEIFEYGVKIENFESSFLFELNGSKASDMFYTLWNIDQDFPPMLISKFIRLLPFAYKIVGNISLASHILSALIEEEVKLNEKQYQKYSDKNNETILGNSRLGLDSIAGTEYDDYSKHIEIKIGPLQNSSLTDFIHEGKKKRFTELFYEYFFPIEVDIISLILLHENDEKFELDHRTDAFLGYNTCI